jgi:large subunit ribosomal protein L9
MKVILLQDVNGIGKKNDVVEVKNGYGANYLIPHKLATAYTTENIEVIKKEQEAEIAKQEALRVEAEETKEKLSHITLEFTAKSGSDGRMIGTISFKQVENELLNKFNLKIDKRKIVDKYQINAFGITKLNIQLFKGVIGTIKIHVNEEK